MMYEHGAHLHPADVAFVHLSCLASTAELSDAVEADQRCEELSSSDDDDPVIDEKIPQVRRTPLQTVKLGHRRLLKTYRMEGHTYVNSPAQPKVSVTFAVGVEKEAELICPNATQRVGILLSTPVPGAVGKTKLDYILVGRQVAVWAACKEGCCPNCNFRDLKVKE
ncbi:hypothetical protein ABBQ32_013266 [Trebouxia sp. C0010 RCD-2024]